VWYLNNIELLSHSDLLSLHGGVLSFDNDTLPYEVDVYFFITDLPLYGDVLPPYDSVVPLYVPPPCYGSALYNGVLLLCDGELYLYDGISSL
jgi:hypothetical protein